MGLLDRFKKPERTCEEPLFGHLAGGYVDIAPRLRLGEVRTAEERAFVGCLEERATRGDWLGDSWIWEDRLIVSVSPQDEEERVILRTIRADFFGDRVVIGDDPTDQIVGDLDRAQQGVAVKSGPPEELAEFVADWFERELARPIERREWKHATFEHREWVMVDSGRRLMWSDSSNRNDRALGQPHRIVQAFPRARR